ncbi:unnamed protein product [Arabidopsis arenosa]|uniref:Uncharacterized protein n=1 Tax=Arabidopsis arenosa TaxID=38785 RepID=A0A8S2ASC2_ARAAE|nr:unnamed protein product [Arabidopsis arenosa]
MLGENTTVHNVLSDMVDRASSETSLEELWYRLHTAITELQAVRFSNTMNRKVINELIALQDKESNVSNEVCIAREAVQKATLALSLAEARLQVLMESARHDASEVEDEVLKTMIWGEKAIELEREATQDVKDAEAAFERALQALDMFWMGKLHL